MKQHGRHDNPHPTRPARLLGYLGAVAALGAAAMLSLHAGAARTVSVSPQGAVTQVRQVVVKFDEPMVAFGAASAPNPARVTCTDPAAGRGQGRWLDDRIWAYDFRNDLPPGVRCAVTLDDALRSVAGNAASGPRRFTFQTGGPVPLSVRPGSNEIEERQVFALKLDGPADERSALANIWCEAAGIGNRISVTAAPADTRRALLEHFGWKNDAPRVLTLSCAQALPASATMQLVYGKGVASPSGIANDKERRFDFTVRAPFAVRFSCERENAKAPCTPLRPLIVSFNAPISRRNAEAIRLRGPDGSRAPSFVSEDVSDEVTAVTFAAPLPAQAALTVELPSGLRDVSGRPLSNADLFPLATRTAPMPPLAKFPSDTFGIVERFAEPGMPALVPVTLRNVEADLHIASLDAGGARFSNLKVDNDKAIREWMRNVERFSRWSMTARSIDSRIPGLLERRGQHPVYLLPESGEAPRNPLDRVIDVRSLSLLQDEPGVQALTLPKADPKALRPFETIGVPIDKPGFYVLELASPALGRSLLAQPSTMYVRTTVLVTNLGVHLKQGQENNLVWVTTLDSGKPVPNAEIHVSDCTGDEIATGRTDAHGLLKIDGPFEPKRRCDVDERFYDYFVSARVDDPKTGPDMAFVSSDWNRGIESWRFDVPTDMSPERTERAHTVFDRTLLRAGETVSMKHFVRAETLQSLAFPSQYPARVTIRHLGTDQTYRLPLKWAADHSADTQFTVPAAAKPGEYSVELEDGPEDAPTASRHSGSFRVEAFRLPVLKGSIDIRDAQKRPLVAAKEAPLAVQIDYVSGGGASNLPVQVSALMRSASPPFADRYEPFSFAPYRAGTNQQMADDGQDDDATSASDAADTDTDAARLVADKIPLTLDRNGAGSITLKGLPDVNAPKRLALEATFADPNGEVQTIRGDTILWPAAVVAGIKARYWVSVGERVPVEALAVDLQGRPLASVPIAIKGVAQVTTSSRKRMVGGFYAYDNRSSTHDLGVLCSGRTDDKGRLSCNAPISQAGNVQLIAVATDGAGRTSNASTSVWATRGDDLWFGGENTDRIDVIPEKTSYEPGETARFQVRMPFRHATALVAVERGGVMETHVVELNGKNPTVDLKVGDTWGPNVYVSVLALRGRLREVPWYSFFTWGWKAPLEWARAFWREGRHYTAPTALVDLSKPAFRYGLAEVKVGTGAHRLGVTVTTDATRYTVRGNAQAHVKVTLPDGRPAPAGTQIAVAAVDEALLELMPNRSWDLLDAMLRRRAYGVETATAQMEIVGRRHFGRKAVPAGGGGGSAPTRELFDTLLLWNPRVTLDANGSASVAVPLNDALTRFRIVAIAAVGPDRFGTGSTSIRSTQDLQLISGLPPLVREGDAFRAQVTLRNTTDRAMRVVVTPRVTGLDLAPQTVSLAADTAGEVAWTVTVPEQAFDAAGALMNWRIDAVGQDGERASDSLAITQKVLPALPVTVQQATLAQVDGTLTVPVAAPASAANDARGIPRGGIAVSLQSKLADGLPGVQRWFERYPYRCLEQQASRAIGLRDAGLWQAMAARMPVYLDRDGLANYFPPSSDDSPYGSPTLSSYLLVLSDEASRLDARFALPEDVRAQLEAGLVRFVDGRIERNPWAPRQDRDLRKLAAIEALSRYGAAQGRMLDSIEIAPNQWPTSAVIDYHAVLTRVKDIPHRDEKRSQVEQILRARLTYQGTQLVFSTARDDDLWWLMTGNETNAARLALEFAGDPAWKDEMPRVTAGLLALQNKGAWQTTTSNALGLLAIERFSRTYESTPVTGTTNVALGADERAIAWSRASAEPAASATAATRAAPARSVMLRWPRASETPATLTVTQNGTGRPWATIESLAAVPLRAPFAAGYRIVKTVTPLSPAVDGVLTRGDVVRVHLDIDAQSAMTWVVVNDPVPSGATILGSGLGRDSEAATQGETMPDGAWPTFIERDFDGYRAYYDYLPKGKFSVEYTVRLNNVGTFGLPPTRVEALYAPSVYGLWPNPRMTVKPVDAGKR